MKQWQYQEDFWDPPGIDNACGYFALSAYLGLPTIYPNVAYDFIVQMLRNVGHHTTESLNKGGVPMDVM